MADTLRESTEPQTAEELCRLYRSLTEQLREQLQQIESDKHDLEAQMLDRVGNLESRNLELREQFRQVEADKRYIETQKIRYETGSPEIQKRERAAPEPAADHRHDRRRGRCNPGYCPEQCRTTVFGPEFTEHQPRRLKAGARCTLNQQSLAIVELLPSSFDAQVYGMELVDSPQENYADIGGLNAPD